MRNQIVLRSKQGPPLIRRRQPLLKQSTTSRFAEVAGVTTAECAAIACCCPCGLANLVVLVVYKVPAGLCRRALRERRRRRRRRLMKEVEDEDERVPVGMDEEEWKVKRRRFEEEDKELQTELLELEKEMWDHFYTGGFWRSPSRTD